MGRKGIPRTLQEAGCCSRIREPETDQLPFPASKDAYRVSGQDEGESLSVHRTLDDGDSGHALIVALMDPGRDITVRDTPDGPGRALISASGSYLG